MRAANDNALPIAKLVARAEQGDLADVRALARAILLIDAPVVDPETIALALAREAVQQQGRSSWVS